MFATTPTYAISRVPADIITDEAGLSQLIEKLNDVDRFAVDTEFTRESSYYPKLGLIQIGTETWVSCIDPLAVDCTPLYDLFASDQHRKIFHAARQDLEVLYFAMKRPVVRIFDTQLGAAFIGLERQISYKSLVKTFLGLELDQSETRSDWSKRPLTDKQLKYAAEDVRYLTKISGTVKKRLKNAYRYGWFKDEMRRLYSEIDFEIAPEEAWHKIRGRGKLSAIGQHTLAKLASWRESEARAQDKPRSWVINDGALLWLSQTLPTETEQLNELRDDTARETYGSTLLSLIAEARSTFTHTEPEYGEDDVKTSWKMTTEQLELVKILQEKLQELAQSMDLDASLLARKADVLEFVRNPRDNVLVNDKWRFEAIQEVLKSS